MIQPPPIPNLPLTPLSYQDGQANPWPSILSAIAWVALFYGLLSAIGQGMWLWQIWSVTPYFRQYGSMNADAARAIVCGMHLLVGAGALLFGIAGATCLGRNGPRGFLLVAACILIAAYLMNGLGDAGLRALGGRGTREMGFLVSQLMWSLTSCAFPLTVLLVLSRPGARQGCAAA